MSFSGGVYTLPGPALVTGDTVSATENNQFRNDVAGAFNLTFLRNGTSAATADLPMGGYKLTGLGVATTSGDALSYGQAATVSNFTASGTVTISSGTANGVAYLNGSKVLTTGSALQFDGSNLGLGVTPSAWASTFRALDGFSGFAVSGQSQLDCLSNAYWNGTNWIYKLTSAATRYSQLSGSHTWHVAPSGTAGNPITFTQAMTLDASGNLGLGVTPSAWAVNFPVVQIKNAGFFGVTGGSYAGMAANAFVSSNSFLSTSNYISTAPATAYLQSIGAHVWYTSPSGTAGNTITWTQAMTLDASGRLGVGAISPGYKLDIQASPAVTSNQIFINFNRNTGANSGYGDFMQTGSATSGAWFGRRYLSPSGWMAAVTGSNGAVFNTGDIGSETERMRIDSAGYLRMASGSGGIQFNGDTAAANALNDYEEGTFTPTVYGTTTAGTATYTAQTGRYTKIGDRVFIQIALGWNSHTGTGNAQIGGLPFTTLNSTQARTALAGFTENFTFSNNIAFMTNSNATSIYPYSWASNAAVASIAMDASGSFYIAGHYEV